jgi:hypothetical protein
MLRELDVENNFHIKIKELMDNAVFNQEKEMGFVENWRIHSIWK